MSLCVLCGGLTPDGSAICVYHCSTDEDWATANRIMCDFVHRAIVPRRLAAEERDPIVVDEGELATAP